MKDDLLEEVFYTPNNAHMKYILVSSIIAAILMFAFSLYFDPSVMFVCFLYIGYIILSLKFWFFGALLGLTSPKYNDKTRLKLSSFWATITPIVASASLDYENYDPIVFQLVIMAFIRFWFLSEAISNRIE